MTLAEAINHIQSSDGCDKAAALHQLRMALGEGEIQARWASDHLPPGVFLLGGPRYFSDDGVPTDANYWATVLILLEADGTVIDQKNQIDEGTDELESTEPRRRQLLLLRSGITAIWSPTTNLEVTANRRSDIAKPASRANIYKAAAEIYETGGDNPPNVTAAEQIIRSKLGKVPRKLVREVLRRPEFARRRNPTGNRPKKQKE
jgi:hypothetical protein